MRALVKFPNRAKPIEREVRTLPNGFKYIVSKKHNVTVYEDLCAGNMVYFVGKAWEWLYRKEA